MMLLQVFTGIDLLFVLITLFVIAVIIFILVSGVRIIQPYQQGLWILLGQYRGRLNPGFNWVVPTGKQRDQA